MQISLILSALCASTALAMPLGAAAHHPDLAVRSPAEGEASPLQDPTSSQPQEPRKPSRPELHIPPQACKYYPAGSSRESQCIHTDNATREAGRGETGNRENVKIHMPKLSPAAQLKVDLRKEEEKRKKKAAEKARKEEMKARRKALKKQREAEALKNNEAQ